MKSLNDEMGITVFHTIEDDRVELYIKDGKLVRISFSLGNCVEVA